MTQATYILDDIIIITDYWKIKLFDKLNEYCPKNKKIISDINEIYKVFRSEHWKIYALDSNLCIISDLQGLCVHMNFQRIGKYKSINKKDCKLYKPYNYIKSTVTSVNYNYYSMEFTSEYTDSSKEFNDQYEKYYIDETEPIDKE